MKQRSAAQGMQWTSVRWNLCVQDGLKRLWEHAFPGVAWQGLLSNKWTDMGWQRNDPSSDFRGAGLIALQNHLHMAQVSHELLLAL